MAKRYSPSEKAALLAAYASSGLSVAAFSRSSGVSSITLRSWQQTVQLAEASGFEAIEAPLGGSPADFRLFIGRATVECGTLPPAQWVSELIKGLSA